MAKAAKRDTLDPLWRAIQGTPIQDIDREHVRRELSRIKQLGGQEHDQIAQLCGRLLALLRETDELAEPLRARKKHEEELARLRAGAHRFFCQCEILRLFQWSGSSIAAMVPIFQAASMFVFGKSPGLEQSEKIIARYRREHFERMTETVIMRPSKILLDFLKKLPPRS